MSIRDRHHKRGDRGAAAVEFGLLLPILLLVIFGIIQFGLAFNAQLALSAGAREGVRALAIGGTDAVTRTKEAAAPLPAGAVDVHPGPACPASPGPTDKANITALYQFNASANPAYEAFRGLMGLFGGSIPATITLTGTGEMRCLG